MKFKVGDRVKIVKDSRDSRYTKYFRYLNNECIITNIDGLNFYARMPSDNNIEIFVFDDADLVSSSKEEVIFEVGDEVEVVATDVSIRGKRFIIDKINNNYVGGDNPRIIHDIYAFRIKSLKLIKKHNQTNNLTQTKTVNQNEKAILSRKVSTISRGEELNEEPISSRTGRLAIAKSNFSYKAISI